MESYHGKGSHDGAWPSNPVCCEGDILKGKIKYNLCKDIAEVSTSLPGRFSKRKTTFLEPSRVTKKKRHNCDSGSHDPESIEYLSAEGILEGMVILGCITEIRTSCLKFALPGCLQGTVSINDISLPYNMCLEKNEVLDSLNAMFHIGQTLACKVLTVNKCAKSQKLSMALSINPSVVNKDLRHSTMCQNMVLNAAVTSIEDHGYVMDIGNQIPSFIDKSSVDYALKVGQVLQAIVSVVDISCRVVSLVVCNNPEKLKETSHLSLSCFFPGTKVDAIIQMQRSQGLLLNVIGFPGCICKQHFTCQQLKKSSTDSGIKISGTVLYVHPLTRMIYLVQNKHLSLKSNARRKWDIFDNATVISVCKNSVFLNLEKSFKGQAMKWELSDKKIDDLSNYGVNTVHKCRVLSIHPMDGIIKVTLKQSAFRMKILNPGELEIGQIVKAKVKKFIRGGMVVKLSSNIQGLVRDIHMAAGYIKNPNSLYVPGSEVTCRILSMDFNISPYSLTLTCKKMLLNPDLSILSAYIDAYPGFITVGVIVDITPKTLLLSFFNDVQGIVLDSKSGNLEQMYFIGQVVKCRVMHSEPEKNMLRVSLKIDDSNLIKSKLDQTNSIVLGQVRDVILTSKKENGYDVRFVDSSDTAFLPNGHLTDILESLDCLKKSFVVNDILSVLQFSSRKINIVSRKFSFIQAAKRNSIFTSMNCFQVGMIIPAVVKSHQPDGMIVDLGCNIKGFVPKKFIKDKVVNLTRYQPCQSLMAKIVSLDKSEKKIELSTRICDVYDGNPEYGLDVLQCYLKDNEKIKKYYQTCKGQKRKLSKLEVGNTTIFKVAFVKSKQIYGKLENGILAVADTENCAENIESDQLCAGVILFIDYENCCVHLSLSAHLVKCVKAFQHLDLQSSKIKIGQLIKCSTVFISENFIFVQLLDVAVGSFAYLPSKQVINDEIGQSSFYSIGQSYQVIIKRILDGKVLAVLKKHDSYIPQLSQELNSSTHFEIEKDIELEKNTKQNCTNVIQPSIHETPKIETEENRTGFGIVPLDDESLLLKYPIGKIFTAIITGKREFQLNVVINDELKGRIHVTDLGCSSEGLFPIRKFKTGDELKIRIVEFNEIKCHDFLPISHCYFRKYAECVPIECPYISPYKEFCVGENVIGFIKEIGDESLVVWLTSKQTAHLPFLHIPLCIKELRRIKRNFKIGQAVVAQVLHKTKSHYVLSKLGYWNPYPGENVTAVVQSICPDKGLVVHLAHGYHGEIPVNDISSNHNAIGDILLQFLKQRFIVCKVLLVNTEAKLCCLSVLSSR